MSQDFEQNVRQRIAKNVFKYRTLQNMRREKLSLLLNADNSYISKLEKCRINATIDKLELIAEYLGIDIADLFTK